MVNDRSVITEFLEPVPNPLRETAEKIILGITENFKELDYAVKWHQLTFGINRDFHHWICAVRPSQKSIGLVFHFGGLLEDKDQLFLKGESIFFRKLEYKDPESVDFQAIEYFIKQALSRLDYFKANWKELNRNKKSKQQ